MNGFGEAARFPKRLWIGLTSVDFGGSVVVVGGGEGWEGSRSQTIGLCQRFGFGTAAEGVLTGCFAVSGVMRSVDCEIDVAFPL